jgi:hypothetical protein
MVLKASGVEHPLLMVEQRKLHPLFLKALEISMTKTELLKATGNIWRVDCWHDGNRRRIVQTLYIRASDVLAAEEVGRRQSGRRCVDAVPWNPKTDRKVFGYVQEVSDANN